MNKDAEAYDLSRLQPSFGHESIVT